MELQCQGNLVYPLPDYLPLFFLLPPLLLLPFESFDEAQVTRCIARRTIEISRVAIPALTVPSRTTLFLVIRLAQNTVFAIAHTIDMIAFAILHVGFRGRDITMRRFFGMACSCSLLFILLSAKRCL